MADTNQQMKLIVQALAAAQASIDLARQLLGELPGGVTLVKPSGRPVVVGTPSPQPAAAPVRPIAREVPGVIGTFDGENLVTPSGEKFKVGENYASKTGVVFGDKLKMIDSITPAGTKFFKQIERVKRLRVEGILSQTGSAWKLMTPGGSHKVLEAAVKHFGAQAGTEMFGLLPRDHPEAPFAALEGLVRPPVKVSVPSLVDNRGSTPNAEPKSEVVPKPALAENSDKSEEVGKKKTVGIKEKKEAAEKKTAKKGDLKELEKKSLPEEKKAVGKSELLIGDDELR